MKKKPELGLVYTLSERELELLDLYRARLQSRHQVELPREEAARSLLEFAFTLALERECRECGCTDGIGCAEGCHWVESDLCSRCADAAAVRKATGEIARAGAVGRMLRRTLGTERAP